MGWLGHKEYTFAVWRMCAFVLKGIAEAALGHDSRSAVNLYLWTLAAQAPRKRCVLFEVHKISHRSHPSFGKFKAGLTPV